jgi:hypothetical protein
MEEALLRELLREVKALRTEVTNLKIQLTNAEANLVSWISTRS